jgi:hypothetical protein
MGELATGDGAYGEDELVANGGNGLKEVALAGVCMVP